MLILSPSDAVASTPMSASSMHTHEIARWPTLRDEFPLPAERGEGQGEGCLENTRSFSGNVFKAFPLTPALSLGERENLPPRFRQSRASRFVAARDAVFPLPAGEGQGEGERDGANQNDRTNLASSTRPSPRVKVGYHIGPKACRERKRAV